MQLFSASDYKQLLESVNAKMLTYSEASTFLRQIRGVLGGGNGSATTMKSDQECFEQAREVVEWWWRNR